MNISPTGTTLAFFLLEEVGKAHGDPEGGSKDTTSCEASVSLPTQEPESNTLPSTSERAFKGLVTVYPANEYD
jgi:hypothetical protein